MYTETRNSMVNGCHVSLLNVLSFEVFGADDHFIVTHFTMWATVRLPKQMFISI